MAGSNYTVHLFDLNGFGYSGGRRFSADEKTINGTFLAVLNNLNKSHPLFGQLTSLRPWIRSHFFRQFFGGVLGQRLGADP